MTGASAPRFAVARATLGGAFARERGRLALAALVFLMMHLLVSGTRVRDSLVGAIGRGPYMGLFSLASVAAPNRCPVRVLETGVVAKTALSLTIASVPVCICCSATMPKRGADSTRVRETLPVAPSAK